MKKVWKVYTLNMVGYNEYQSNFYCEVNNIEQAGDIVSELIAGGTNAHYE